MAEQHLGLYSDQDYVREIILSRCHRLAVVGPKRTGYPQAALHRWVSHHMQQICPNLKVASLPIYS